MLAPSPVWHVLRVRGGRELAVAERIGGWCPSVIEWWRSKGLYGRKKRYDTGRPVLTGYCFRRAPVPSWAAILEDDDVNGVLAKAGGGLAVVAHAELLAMQRAAGKAPIGTGSKVEVRPPSPFAGHLVEIRSVDQVARMVEAEVALLGATRTVAIGVDMLAA